MTDWVHFYPFAPAGEHGGTLRLRTARDACAALGEQRLFWFDAVDGRWREDAPSEHRLESGSAGGQSLKRKIFPSTLYESGRAAVAAFETTDFDALIGGSANVILHTTYLGPLAQRRARWMDRVVLDAYDLVWRAHAIDGRTGPLPYRLARHIYSETVKRREAASLAAADVVPVAGYEDWLWARHRTRLSGWCPTGMTATPAPLASGDGPLRIGFLGNFAHQATLDSARALLAAPAAVAPDVEVVLGGWASDGLADDLGDRATVVGPVATAADFWSQVDCAVIPVPSGAGMKCKISEALLAGRPVVTTPLGAEGFDPTSRESMRVVSEVAQITPELCREAATATPDPARLTGLGREGAAAIYRALIAAA